MYQKKYINFLKEYNIYDEDLFKYIKDRTIYVDYQNEEYKDFIGCYPIEKNGYIKDIRLCVPQIKDDISIAINIHEYVHLKKMYKNLDKKYTFSKDEEVLPIFYEMLFLANNNTEETDNYIEFYKTSIKENNIKEYVYALDIWNSIIEQKDCKVLKR